MQHSLPGKRSALSISDNLFDGFEVSAMNLNSFVKPLLLDYTPDVPINTSGGWVISSIRPKQMTVTLPDGTEVVVDEYGNIIE